jgi:hypothetical protein
VIGEFGELLVAEALTPDALVGKPLQESGLRQRTGLSVAGSGNAATSAWPGPPPR